MKMSKNTKNVKNAGASPKAKKNKYKSDAATAPYNFIFQTDSTKSYEDKDVTETYSGVITCSLQNLTPLLIGDVSNRDEKDKNRYFFRVGDEYVIPGSSLKGMIRTVVETLSFSKISPVSSSPIFWRNVVGDDNNTYKREFSDEILGGYIKRIGFRYYFYECKVTREKEHDKVSRNMTDHATAEDDLDHKSYLYTGPMKDNDSGKTIRRAYKFKQISSEPVELEQKVVNEFNDQLKPCKDQQNIWIYDKEKFDVGDKARVFCIKDKVSGKIKHIGTAHYFRIPHESTPSDLVDLGNISKDFAKNLFGYIRNNSEKAESDAKRGKVRVGRCTLSNCELSDPLQLVLGTPKPSCVQNYLFQEKKRAEIEKKKEGKKAIKIDDFSLYKKGAQLRGRKFYWHRDPVTANSAPVKDKVGETEVILHPIKAGAYGEFNITLLGVSEYELGAVLEALCFSDYGGAYKIGMGKPYGLGSVNVDIESVSICKDSERYSSLSSRIEETSKELSEDEIKLFRDNFKSKTSKTINTVNYDDNQSIRQLRIITDYHHRPDNADTAYMSLDKTSLDNRLKGFNTVTDFKEKQILPLIEDVRNPATKEKR